MVNDCITKTIENPSIVLEFSSRIKICRAPRRKGLTTIYRNYACFSHPFFKIRPNSMHIERVHVVSTWKMCTDLCNMKKMFTVPNLSSGELI